MHTTRQRHRPSDRSRSLSGVEPAITVHRLEVRFGDAVALAGVDLEIAAGSSLAVIGPNGSGKSTLLGAVAGTLVPHAGSVVTGDRRVALVLQSTDVDRSLPITVRESVALARYPHLGLFRPFRRSDRQVVEASLERLAVSDLADRQLHELSGGQRQRVMVAQGLAQQADVLLLDEPVNGLDLVSRAIILEVIEQELSVGTTVAITTHDLDEARRFDRVLLLDTEPVADGRPDEVLTVKNLRRAFGGQLIDLGDGIVVDDPHH